jgi:hypothetical protein
VLVDSVLLHDLGVLAQVQVAFRVGRVVVKATADVEGTLIVPPLNEVSRTLGKTKDAGGQQARGNPADGQRQSPVDVRVFYEEKTVSYPVGADAGTGSTDHFPG